MIAATSGSIEWHCSPFSCPHLDWKGKEPILQRFLTRLPYAPRASATTAFPGRLNRPDECRLRGLESRVVLRSGD